MFERIAKRILRIGTVQKRLEKKVSTDRAFVAKLGAINPGEKENEVLKRYFVHKTKMLIIIGCAATALLAVTVWAGHDSGLLKEGGTLIRNDAGEGGYETYLVAQVKGEEYPLDVTVAERKLTKEEISELFNRAKAELDGELLGENDSAEHITQDLFFPESLAEGMVAAEWSVSDYRIIDSSGRVKNEDVSEKGTIVRLSAELSYREEIVIYEQYVKVFPPDKNQEEIALESLKNAVDAADEATCEDTEFVLPAAIGDVPVTWKEERQNAVCKMLLLLIILTALFLYHDKNRVREGYMRRQQQLLIDYPQFVSKLSLLLEAGMTIGKAWEKIAIEYRDSKEEKRYVYEEMLIIYYQMQEGLGEKDAYELFGQRCSLREYLKLSSVITQNLKKGSEGLGELLEAEVRDAFESRKSLAKQRGEEAGTRLLGPMMILMVIVMVIVTVPGIITFSG